MSKSSEKRIVEKAVEILEERQSDRFLRWGFVAIMLGFSLGFALLWIPFQNVSIDGKFLFTFFVFGLGFWTGKI